MPASRQQVGLGLGMWDFGSRQRVGRLLPPLTGRGRGEAGGNLLLLWRVEVGWWQAGRHSLLWQKTWKLYGTTGLDMEKWTPARRAVRLEVLFHLVVVRHPTGGSQGAGRNGRPQVQAHAGGGESEGEE